ncbi:hypothetical protein HY624_01170 [Candidatus Uhrbacteria bacterium]|nr:hypothetical protein [Candidatus Uhrbacteria bacterium]
MLIQRELPWLQIIVRLAGIAAIIVAAIAVWYFNPFRPSVDTGAPEFRTVTLPPSLAVPTDTLEDPRLQNFESPLTPPIPLNFGRPDPFASIIPPPLPDLSNPETKKPGN